MKLALLFLAAAANTCLSTSAVQAASIRRKRQLQPTTEELCSDESNTYFITPATVTGEQAFDYCHSLGGRLADVDNTNLSILTSLVNNCIGTNNRARIQTWDTNAFGSSNLAILAGPLSGYGTVNIAGRGEALHALCVSYGSSAISPPDSIVSPVVFYDDGEYSLNKIQEPEEDYGYDYDDNEEEEGNHEQIVEEGN